MIGFHQRLARLVGCLAIVGSMVLAGSGPVAADTDLGHTGLVGANSLTDTLTKPGTRCDYITGDGREGAATVNVRPPKVFARNRTAGLDRQTVGWRVVLQQSEDFVTWYTDEHSPVVKALATDATKAAFSPMSIAVPFNLFVRVHVVMFWYVPGSTTVVQGRSVREVDDYVRFLDGTFEDNVAESCPHDLTP